MNKKTLLEYKNSATEYANILKNYNKDSNPRSGLFFVKEFVDKNLDYLLQIPEEFDPSCFQDIIDTNNLVVVISESLFRRDDFSIFLRYVDNKDDFLTYENKIIDILNNYPFLESTWTVLTSLLTSGFFKEDLNNNYEKYKINKPVYEEYLYRYRD